MQAIQLGTAHMIPDRRNVVDTALSSFSVPAAQDERGIALKPRTPFSQSHPGRTMNRFHAAWLALRGDHAVIPLATHEALLRRVATAERRAKAQKDARAARTQTLPPIGAAE